MSRCPTGFNAHRYRAYGTNEPTEACVRCGNPHADSVRVQVKAQAKAMGHARAQRLDLWVECVVCGRTLKARYSADGVGPYPANHQLPRENGWCWGRARIGVLVDGR